MRISGLLESDNEEAKNVVTKFLTKTFYVHNLDLTPAFCIKNRGAQFSTIIFKFVDQAQRDTAITNKYILKGPSIG